MDHFEGDLKMHRRSFAHMSTASPAIVVAIAIAAANSKGANAAPPDPGRTSVQN